MAVIVNGMVVLTVLTETEIALLVIVVVVVLIFVLVKVNWVTTVLVVNSVVKLVVVKVIKVVLGSTVPGIKVPAWQPPTIVHISAAKAIG